MTRSANTITQRLSDRQISLQQTRCRGITQLLSLFRACYLYVSCPLFNLSDPNLSTNVSVNPSYFSYVSFVTSCNIYVRSETWSNPQTRFIFCIPSQFIYIEQWYLVRETISRPQSGSPLFDTFLLHMPCLYCEEMKLSEVRAGNRLKISNKHATVKSLISYKCFDHSRTKPTMDQTWVLVTLPLRVAQTGFSHSEIVSDWQPVACQWLISVVGRHGKVSVEEEENWQFIEWHQRGSKEKLVSFKSSDWLKSQRGWSALSLSIQVYSAELACAHIVNLTRWWRSQWDKRSRVDEKKWKASFISSWSNAELGVITNEILTSQSEESHHGARTSFAVRHTV